MHGNAALKEPLTKNVWSAAKREVVAHLCGALEMSERRACTIIAADWTMIRYRSRRAPDTELRIRLRELANQHRRFAAATAAPPILPFQELRVSTEGFETHGPGWAG